MMEPTTSANEIKESIVTTEGPNFQLRKLLLEPQAESEEWQETVGRLVSQLHVRTLQVDTSDSDFLECINLVTKAQAAGNKIAKKKTINAARFKDRAPNDFSLVLEPDDQKTSLNLLSKVKSDWCLRFIGETLQRPSTDKSVYPILIKWAAKCSENASTLWNAALLPLLAIEIDEKTKLASVKEFEKCAVDFINKTDTAQSLRDSKDLMETLSQSLIQVSENKKLSSSIISATCSYISSLREEIPCSIIDGVLVAGIADFTHKLATNEQSKEWDVYRTRLTSAAASMLNSIIKTLGPSSADYWRNHIPNLARAYPSLADTLKTFGSENQLINQLFDVKSSSSSSANNQYETEATLSSLLLTWQNFRARHEEMPETDSIDLLLKKVAKFLGIEFFGTIGTSCVYDPIEHNLIDQSNLISDVTVMQQGIRLTRADGSTKILHPAIVK